MSAALAAAVLLLAIAAGSATASESHGALRDPYVAPRHGTPATVIRFSVTFQGHGLRSDAHVSVLIDGVPRAMAPALDVIVAHGDRYRLSTTLPAGVHTIRFRGSDGSGTASIGAGQVEIDGGSGGGPIGGGGGGNDPGASPSEPPAQPTATPPAPTAPPPPTPTPAPTAAPTTEPAPTPTPAPTAPAEATPTPTPRANGGSSDGAGPTPSPSTGGAQATSTDAPGAADHTSGPGGGPASGGSPAGAPPTAGREYDSAGAIAVLSPTSTPEGLAFGLTGTPEAGGGGSGGSGGTGGSGGRLDDRGDPGLGLLTGDGTGIPPETRMLVAAISTTTTATAVAAFFLFGKRRRDGEPPAPDEVLAANAGRLGTTPASQLVPEAAGEEGIPRWRRPSLIQARKTDPRYSAAAAHDRMSFNHGGDPGTAGTERRKIRYRAVSLLDAPDPLRSAAIGDLDEGDEVQLLEKSGGYWLVLCPDGSRGWVHRMTLGDVVEYEGGSGAFNAARRSFTPRIGEADNDRTDDTEDGNDGTGTGAGGGAGGAGEAGGAGQTGAAPEWPQAADDRSYAEDGTDLLTAYLQSRRASTT